MSKDRIAGKNGNEIIVKKEGGIAVIKYTGFIDTDTYVILKEALEKLIKEASYKIIIDVSDTTFMSSADGRNSREYAKSKAGRGRYKTCGAHGRSGNRI